MSLESQLSESNSNTDNEEYLVRCVVDTSSRRFSLYSNEGNEKVVQCDNVQEFMNVLEFVRATVTPDNIAELAYSNPL
jgi:hypothetical protein